MRTPAFPVQAEHPAACGQAAAAERDPARIGQDGAGQLDVPADMGVVKPGPPVHPQGSLAKELAAVDGMTQGQRPSIRAENPRPGVSQLIR
jgi:hypothetical protein